MLIGSHWKDYLRKDLIALFVHDLYVNRPVYRDLIRPSLLRLLPICVFQLLPD